MRPTTDIQKNKTALLRTHDLSIGYKNASQTNLLMEDLNLQVNTGELICFMGPNGVGKSTLIRTLSGLQKPLSGSVSNSMEQGESGLNPKTISVVLTDRITVANMTVYEIVMYGRYPYVDWNLKMSSADKDAIDQAIALTRISHLVGRKLYELSDGQMQMAMIARALAQNTPLIVLDEPTAHLDLNNRVEIMNLLRNLAHTEGKGILLATHELDLALQTADVVWLSGKNKNILQGIPEDLVLNGSFDEIFQLKGFDLKTGKVFHDSWREIAVQLNGEGHEYMWTKNALERNGFNVSDKGKSITINHADGKLYWNVESDSYNSLHDLIVKLSES